MNIFALVQIDFLSPVPEEQRRSIIDRIDRISCRTNAGQSLFAAGLFPEDKLCANKRQFVLKLC